MTFFHLSSRRLSSSSTCSAWSDDHHHHGISPGAAPTNQTHHHHQSSNDNSKNSYHSAMATQVQHLLQDDGSGSRRQSSVSQRSCEGLTAGDCKDLWRCMLELQERYGCYHSTRIDIAVEAGDAGVSFMREFYPLCVL